MIIIKSQHEIEMMRKAGILAVETMKHTAALIRPGVTTGELDHAAETFIRAHGGIPACKGYGGFPGTLCTSVNDVVVHGIPGPHKLEEGDIISLDLVVELQGYMADMARTYAVGSISDEAAGLIDITRACFYKGLEQIRVGNRLGDVSHAIGEHAESNGYGVIRDYCGHGIGRDMHEDPEIPNYGRAGRGVRLQEGMILAVEPMITTGDWRVSILSDDWTAVTVDGSLAAHYENTVAVTKDGPVILTAEAGGTLYE